MPSEAAPLRDPRPSPRPLGVIARRFVPLGAALLTAVAAWCSLGAIGFEGPGGARLAILPLDGGHVAIVAAAAVAVFLLTRRAPAAPVLLLVLLILPWWPGRLPAAFLIWTGPLTLAVWWGVALALLVPLVRRSPRLRRFACAPGRATLAAGVLAAILFGFAAWRMAAVVPGGDEPHYLVITQSLLYDHDLQIENNHRRGDYHAYFAGNLAPDFLRRGRNGEIYSVHAPGISALVLPAFALAGYPGVVVFLLLVAAAGAALAWHLAWRVTGRMDAAWFGWAAVVFAPTWLLNAFTVYPDGVGAVLVLTGVWALVRARDEAQSGATSSIPWMLHGAALAALPWLHTRFALLAGGFGALVLLHLARTKRPAEKASAFLALPTLSAIAWMLFFVEIYGTPDPSAPYRGSDLGSPSYVPGGIVGLFFDQQFGLLAYAPVLASAIAGLIVVARRRGAFRWLPVELLFVTVPYLITVTHFAMWWGGWSAPARFALPLVPTLAVFAAAAWSAAARRGTRGTLLALLAATAFVAGALVLGPHQFAYHTRDTYAGVLDWVTHVADLPAGLPSFFARVHRGRPGIIFYVDVLWWGLVLLGAWLVVRRVSEARWIRPAGRLLLLTGAVLGGAVMLASTLAWRTAGADGLTPAEAQLGLLREAAVDPRLVALDLSHGRRIPAGEVPGHMRIVTRARLAPLPAPVTRDERDRPLFALPALPAGEYEITARRTGEGGWLIVGVGRDQFGLISGPARDLDTPVALRFPVDVRAIVVRGDDEARAQVKAFELRPLSLIPPDGKLSSGTAQHAVRYGAHTVFFLDDRSFPEPGAFWVAGSRASTVVVQPDEPGAVRLQLRNAPVANVVTLDLASGRQQLSLGPGEERQIVVPYDPVHRAMLVRIASASGFRPSEVDPGSRDERLLGVWIKVQ
ncbi:MAG TPA: hypothetical protein VFX12_12695 [Vicinamibacterales bacterium]|nr:hypothetical protein [Vicinamibacterales bacterium]